MTWKQLPPSPWKRWNGSMIACDQHEYCGRLQLVSSRLLSDIIETDEKQLKRRRREGYGWRIGFAFVERFFVQRVNVIKASEDWRYYHREIGYGGTEQRRSASKEKCEIATKQKGGTTCP